MDESTTPGETGEKAPVRMKEGGFRRIGSVRLTRTETFRKNLPTASWWRDITCEPQEVSLLCDGRQAYWHLAGVVAESNTPSRLGAYTRTNPNDAKDVGTSEAYSGFGYAYSVAEQIGTGTVPEGLEIQLDRGYGVASTAHKRSEGGGGGEFTLWHFTMPAAGHPLAVRRIDSVPDVERYGSSKVTFAVTYFGKDRGTVTVAVSEHFSTDGGHADAMRAAEALVFTRPSGS